MTIYPRTFNAAFLKVKMEECEILHTQLVAAQLWRKKVEVLLDQCLVFFLRVRNGLSDESIKFACNSMIQPIQDLLHLTPTLGSEGGGGVIPPPSEVESVNKMPWDDMVWDFSLYTKAGVRVRRFVLVEKEDSKPEAGEFVTVMREDLEKAKVIIDMQQVGFIERTLQGWYPRLFKGINPKPKSALKGE